MPFKSKKMLTEKKETKKGEKKEGKGKKMKAKEKKEMPGEMFNKFQAKKKNAKSKK